MRLIPLGNVKNGGVRKGLLMNILDKEFMTEVPSCFLYTRHGFVPNMTPDIWESLDHLPQMLSTSLNYIVERDIDRDSGGKGFSSFAGLPASSPLMMCQSDHTWIYKVYGTDNSSASVWAKGGRYSVSPEDFVRHIKAVRPQVVQMLCDNESYPGCSRKRCIKSVDRTMKFTEQSLSLLQEPISAGEILPFGSVTGGCDLQQRGKCAQFMASQKELRGFVIDGLCSKDACFVRLSGDDQVALAAVKETIHHLPSDQPRFMPAVGPPSDIIAAVDCGVHLFDGAFPCIAAEAGWAWTFDNTEAEVWIDFKNDRFVDDFDPIGGSCHCFACRRHSRAYITHLVKTKEILGRTLLTIHNSHQYFQFFNNLREAIANGELQRLKERVDRCPCPDQLYSLDESVFHENSKFT